MFLDYPESNTLLRGETLHTLPSNFLSGLGKRALDDVLGDPASKFLIGSACGDSESYHRDPSVAIDRIGDQLKFASFGIVLDRLTEDVDEFVHGVTVEGDSLTTTESTFQSFIEPIKQVSLAIHNEQEQKTREVEEVIEEVLVAELIDLIENSHAGPDVVVSEPIEKDIPWGGLTVDVHRTLQLIQDSVNRLKRRVVLPAIDVYRSYIGVFATKLIDRISHFVCLP